MVILTGVIDCAIFIFKYVWKAIASAKKIPSVTEPSEQFPNRLQLFESLF